MPNGTGFDALVVPARAGFITTTYTEPGRERLEAGMVTAMRFGVTAFGVKLWPAKATLAEGEKFAP
jgi:hypothetical protein